MIYYIYYGFIFTSFVCKVSVSLPDYVHPHTMEEIAETNYVVLDKLVLCEFSQNKHDNLLIAIKSAPTNREQRNALRQT